MRSPFRWMMRAWAPALAVWVALVPAALAADPREAPAEVIDDVVVPVPREIFAALDRLGEVNWAALVRQSEYGRQTDRTGTALVFGAVIADGFVAVQARDAAATKKLGPKVLELAELLGVKHAVATHANAIMDAAEQGKWTAVRQELDRTQATVRRTMDELRDSRLAQFVSLGGWLRGTEAAASAVLTDFSTDRADLLHQPGLVAHFRRVLEKLDGKAMAQPAVKRMRADLPGMEQRMSAPSLDNAAVKAIRDQCAAIVAELTGKPPEGGPP